MMKYYTKAQDEAMEMLDTAYALLKEKIESGATMCRIINDHVSAKKLDVTFIIDYSEEPKEGYIE